MTIDKCLHRLSVFYYSLTFDFHLRGHKRYINQNISERYYQKAKVTKMMKLTQMTENLDFIHRNSMT